MVYRLSGAKNQITHAKEAQSQSRSRLRKHLGSTCCYCQWDGEMMVPSEPNSFTKDEMTAPTRYDA
jgi:hypothetical protein